MGPSITSAARRRRFEATVSRAFIACGRCGSGAIVQLPRAMLGCRACGLQASRVGGPNFKLVRQRQRRLDLLRAFPDR